MATNDFLFAQTVPHSPASILIGRLSEEVKAGLENSPLLLWIVDSAGLEPHWGHRPGRSVRVVRIDQCTDAELEQTIEQFFVATPKYLPSVYVTRYLAEACASQFEKAIDSVAARLEAHRRARLTRQQDAFAWQRNVLRNLAHYALRSLPPSWAGALAGVPALVCGAGPSLEQSGPALARVASQGLVLAADSSLKALTNWGIEADFAVSVDVAKVPAKCLPAATSPSRVVLSAISPPEWTSALPGPSRFYVSSNQLTLDWLAAVGVPRTKVEVCENCGATALELARFLGCSPICLFGMDLALNADGPLLRHHGAVEASLYTQSGFNAQQQFPRVPGNFSPEVPTHVFGDWRALDQRLAAWPKDLVWVVTDRGARLSNTTVMRPEQFVLPAGTVPKASLLPNLAAPLPPAAPVLRTVAAKLQAFGSGLENAVPGFRRVLETHGPTQLAQALCSLFATPERGQLLGAFSLKLMPQLLPPIEPNVDHWRSLLDELQSLSQEARNAASELASHTGH